MKTAPELLTGLRLEFVFSGSKGFMADGMLDSYDALTLDLELDKACDISIDGVHNVPEHFNIVAGIERIVQEYQKQ